MTRSGSALILVLTITMVTIICITNVWRSTLYAVQLAHKRQCYLQHYYAAQGLLTLAVQLGKLQYDSLSNTHEEYTAHYPKVPCGNHGHYHGIIHISVPETLCVHVRISLVDGQKNVLHGSAMLKTLSDNQFTIMSWDIAHDG